MPRVIAIALLFTLLARAQDSGKQFKQGEFEIYNEVTRDINAANFPKAIGDLDTWKQKYPDSEYKNDREALYAHAYAGANQPSKSLDAAAPLLARELSSVFPGPAGQPTILRLLYSASWAIAHIPNPGPAELVAGEKAARELAAWEQPLAGVSAATWAEARADMREKATAALVYLAMLPGVQAMAKQPPDCAGADAVYREALSAYPDRSVLSYELGRAIACEAKANPEKAPYAIYEFQRAAAVDPTLGGVRSDPKQIQAYADKLYVDYHGGDEGLDELKQQARRMPLPPAGFSIKSTAEIADEKRAAVEAANPQLALWVKIKAALSQPDGQQYFDNELKGAEVPQLAGKLVEARPACRPRELLVAVVAPESQQSAVAEIQLKLDKALAGKPEPGAPFRWEAVPSAFTSEPFLLTMEAESGKLDGLKTTPCVATSAGRSASQRKR
jgi:hypothetical protein